ncbi:MAG: radical SAM protein [Candidatus Hadarchaeota archaeon]|nr:radical SAM protein [Candidatus Hadarchaeota archaeon]
MGKWSRLSLLSLSAGYDRSVPIYHSVARGRSVPLLKTLVSSYCTNNCAYCAFRRERRTHRERFEPAELADIALKLWKRGSIEGVFLSSSVDHDPDGATRTELESAEIMRKRGYTGYLHLRIMPSASRDLIRRAAELGDRIGLNVENPDEGCLAEIRPDIDVKIDVWRRLRWCREEADRRAGLVRAGLDTQFVVGASDETDKQILEATHKLVAELGLRRVYYSGFRPIRHTPLEDRAPCLKVREFRLYQASFLMRDYGFKPGDFQPALDGRGFLRDVDPKFALAQTRPELFPIDLNSAGLKELLLVPGIGPRTARRVLAARDRVSFKSLSDAQRRLGARIRAMAPYLSVGREMQKRLDDFVHPHSFYLQRLVDHPIA